MTDDNHPTDAEGRSEDHQRAIEACQHALDALEKRARDAIVEQFNALDVLPEPDNSGYREAPDC